MSFVRPSACDIKNWDEIGREEKVDCASHKRGRCHLTAQAVIMIVKVGLFPSVDPHCYFLYCSVRCLGFYWEMFRSSLLISVFFLSSYSAYSWWLLPGVPSSVFREDGAVCGLLPGLTRRQRDICVRHRTAMHHVVKGLNAAVYECRSQFKDQRWNCSASHSGFALSHLKVGSKETAYVFALSSAAVSRTLARACAQGIITSCSCGPYPRRIYKQFKWTGCSDNVKYANNFGRKFMDGADSAHSDDARSMMNLHNNRVGRKAVSSSTHRECKCHGVSGSCTMRTCWKVVPRLEDVAASLRKKYFHATKVSVSPEGKALVSRVERTGSRSERYLHNAEQSAPLENELIYLDDSPDYCKEDKINDIQSPRGRECSDKCDTICCGRNYETIRMVKEERCRCKFVWCCEVKCDTCRRIIDRNYCK